MTDKKTIGEQVRDLPSQCNDCHNFMGHCTCPPKEFKCVSEQERLARLEKKAGKMKLQRHEVEVGGTYIYGGHGVTVLHTYYNPYIREGIAIIDDPQWKDMKPVCISELKVVVPDEAIDFVKAFNSVNEDLILYWVLAHISRTRASLAAYFADCHPKVTGQKLGAAMDYIMKEIHNEDPPASPDK